MSKKRRKKKKNARYREKKGLDESNMLKKLRVEIVKTLDFEKVKCYIYNNLPDSNKWLFITNEKRASKILEKPYQSIHRGRFGSHHPPLYLCLRTLKFSQLREIYKVYIDKKKATKDFMIVELYNRFYGKKTSLERRITERENLEDAKEMMKEEYRFIKLCGILVSKDVIGHIFTFINQTPKYFFKIGYICKYFYLTFLCSWRSISIEKRTNVRRISLLVLRNLERVILITRKNKRCDLRKMEVEYIWKNLNASKFRELKIMGIHSKEIFEGIYKLKHSRSKNTSHQQQFPLSNITKLYIDSGSLGLLKHIKLFPKLQNLRVSYVNFELITTLTKLSTLEYQGKLNVVGCSSPSVRSLFVSGLGENRLETICDKIKFENEIKKILTVFPNIHHLELNTKNLEKFFPQYTNQTNFYRKKDDILDLTIFHKDKLGEFTNHCCQLRKLVIREEHILKSLRSSGDQQGFKNELSPGVKYPTNLELEEFAIYSGMSEGNGKIDDIDFCFEDMITSGFFYDSSNIIRRLILHIPLLSRRIEYREALYNDSDQFCRIIQEFVIPTIDRLMLLLSDSHLICDTFDQLFELKFDNFGFLGHFDDKLIWKYERVGTFFTRRLKFVMKTWRMRKTASLDSDEISVRKDVPSLIFWKFIRTVVPELLKQMVIDVLCIKVQRLDGKENDVVHRIFEKELTSVIEKESSSWKLGESNYHLSSSGYLKKFISHFLVVKK